MNSMDAKIEIFSVPEGVEIRISNQTTGEVVERKCENTFKDIQKNISSLLKPMIKDII